MGKSPLTRADGAPARLGELDPSVVKDILCLRDLVIERRKAIMRLTGGSGWRNPLRDELIRLVTIDYADGKIHPVSHYQEICQQYGSLPTIRFEIERLARVEVFALVRSATDRRARDVWPTQRLIDTYNAEFPALRSLVARHISRYDEFKV